MRYTAPSYVLNRPGRTVFTIPGFRGAEVYETAIANLLPDVKRQPPPENATTVLGWAAQPLATVEVAAVLGVGTEEARRRLQGSAAFHAAENDGYWTLRPGGARSRPARLRGPSLSAPAVSTPDT